MKISDYTKEEMDMFFTLMVNNSAFNTFIDRYSKFYKIDKKIVKHIARDVMRAGLKIIAEDLESGKFKEVLSHASNYRLTDKGKET
jgi:hypothetical protein